MTDILTEAIHFATDAFVGKVRKCSNIPAILHSLEAAAIVSSMTNNIDVIAAAVLHDVVEDANITIETLETKFGKRIAELVTSETENKRMDIPASKTWKIRKEEAIETIKNTDDIEIKMLYLGDKLSNIRSMYNDYTKHGEKIWYNFNQKNPKEHEWYYKSIADSIIELKDYPAWQEYNNLLNKLFN